MSEEQAKQIVEQQPKATEERRQEIIKRLGILGALVGHQASTWQEDQFQKPHREEYARLWKELQSLPLNLGTIELRAKVIYEMPNGELIKGSFYDKNSGRPVQVEFDKDGVPLRAKMEVIDPYLQVPVIGVINYRIVENFTPAESKIIHPKLMTLDDMPHWMCPQCQQTNYIECTVCIKCGHKKPEEPETDLPYTPKNQKHGRINLHFRSKE